MQRRQFLGTLTAMGVSPLPADRKRQSRPATARNVLYIHLNGGLCHLDSFDMKTTAQTPDELGAQLLDGHLMWPMAVMPQLAERRRRFALLRALNGVEFLHERANFQFKTSYINSSESVEAVPHLGSVLAHFLTEQDAPLPFGLTFDRYSEGSGGLSSGHKLTLANESGYIEHLEHDPQRRERRFSLLGEGFGRSDRVDAYLETRRRATLLTGHPQVLALNDRLAVGPSHADPITEEWLTQCYAATEILSADLGTRFLELNFLHWDHHYNIYDTGTELHLFRLLSALDESLAYLMDRLEALPAVGSGQSLWDETLVVVGTEFGRTPGPLNRFDGRDHYPYAYAGMVFGGGVQGGLILGATNPGGAYITDTGWNADRPMNPADLVATVFSAMGIDHTQGLRYSGRADPWPIAARVDGSPARVIDALFQG